MRRGDTGDASLAPGSRATAPVDWKADWDWKALDAVAAVESVARALVACRHPVIEQYAEGRETLSCRRGMLEGQREALRLILAQRGLLPDGLQRGSLEDCDDPDLLERWLRRAAVATHADEVFFGRPGAGDPPGERDGERPGRRDDDLPGRLDDDLPGRLDGDR